MITPFKRVQIVVFWVCWKIHDCSTIMAIKIYKKCFFPSTIVSPSSHIVTFGIISFAQFSYVYKKCNIMWNIYRRWSIKNLIVIFSSDYCHDFFSGEPLVRPGKHWYFSIIFVWGSIWGKPIFSFSSIRISISKQKTLVRFILTWEKNCPKYLF